MSEEKNLEQKRQEAREKIERRVAAIKKALEAPEKGSTEKTYGNMSRSFGKSF